MLVRHRRIPKIISQNLSPCWRHQPRCRRLPARSRTRYRRGGDSRCRRLLRISIQPRSHLRIHLHHTSRRRLLANTQQHSPSTSNGSNRQPRWRWCQKHHHHHHHHLHVWYLLQYRQLRRQLRSHGSETFRFVGWRWCQNHHHHHLHVWYLLQHSHLLQPGSGAGESQALEANQALGDLAPAAKASPPHQRTCVGTVLWPQRSTKVLRASGCSAGTTQSPRRKLNTDSGGNGSSTTVSGPLASSSQSQSRQEV